MSTRPELILAIDTSGAEAGVVLSGHGRVSTALLPLRDGGYARTEELAATVGTLLASRNHESADITLVGAVVGPGSYTGLRSGLAFLRGLAFGQSLPAVAVGTLEFLAWRGARDAQSVLVLCPAGAGRTVLAAYRRERDDVTELASPAVMDDDDCARALAGALAIDRQRYAAVIVPAPPAAALAAAAECAGIAVRIAPADALAPLAMLVAARSGRGQTLAVGQMLPVYVGQSSARPNDRRVAVPATPE